MGKKIRGTNRLEFQPLGGELVVEEFEPVDMLRATGDVRRRGAGKGRLAGPAGGRAQRCEGAGRDAGFVPREWGEEGCLEQRDAD